MEKSQKLIVITTGGTIEKVYNEAIGDLYNGPSIFKELILSRLRLPHTQIEIHSLLSTDSLQMDEGNRQYLCDSIDNLLKKNIPIVVVHGTDTMDLSAQFCANHLKNIDVPIVFTGAMRPVGFLDSDAIQNVSEAFLAAQILSPDIYICFHGRIFKANDAIKDKDLGTFKTKISKAQS